MADGVRIVPIDLNLPEHVHPFLALMDHYASDPMGGGTGLDPAVRAVLADRLSTVPHYYGALAYRDGEAVGLINGFFGFSTFAAAPLFNVHDLVVHASQRGRGIAGQLLAHVADHAAATGCCKVTLEVLSNNRAALALYRREGFVPYQLDPAAGQALLLQKML